MLIVAFWVALILATLTTVFTIVSAALGRPESLGFLRLTLTGLFGIVIAQSLAPLHLRWWWVSLISLALMFVLLTGSQLLARVSANRSVGRWLVRLTAPVVKSLNLLFTPLSLTTAEETEEYEQELIESVEEFGETIVREIMAPRIDMVTVDREDSLESAMKVFLERGYSRLPVIGKNIDDVIGVLYLKDIAKLIFTGGFAAKKAGEVARQAIFVPDSKPVDDLLREMQISATHIAIIIDEYGGVAGLATMEDVIEELVGDIADEYDRELPDIEPLGDGMLRVAARCSLFDLGEHFELELEDEDVDSVGGLFAKELGRLPRKGDRIVSSGLEFQAERVEGRRKRLITVLVRPTQQLSESMEAFE